MSISYTHIYMFFFSGNANATKVMQEVLQLLKSINASILDTSGGGTDISPWMQAGVPGASLRNDNDRYFYFHHTNGMYSSKNRGCIILGFGVFFSVG